MLRIERKQDYLIVEYARAFQLEKAIALMRDVAGICRREGFSKVLVDLSNARSEISIMDGFTLGAEGAKLFRGPIQVAVVNHSRLLQFVETVGVNRGGDVCMFTELGNAKKWLGVD